MAELAQVLLYGPTQALMRTTTEAIEVRGTTIPADEYVLLLVGSANRDPEVFERPDEFDVRRDASSMLSFGKGVHFCMGAALARLEACIAFEEWWKRFPNAVDTGRSTVFPAAWATLPTVVAAAWATLPTKPLAPERASLADLVITAAR